jgi:glycosyltransferase 2 family protein
MACEPARGRPILQSLAALRAHPLFARSIKLASWVLIIASALFLALVAQRYWSDVTRIALSPRQWLALGGLAFAYGTALVLLGLAWHQVLVLVGAAPPGVAHCVRAHTSAQLAKYVPGNVFHFVGRHLIHRAAGMDAKRLALAVVVENLLLLAAAACIAAACLAIAGHGMVRTVAICAAALIAAGLPILVRLALTRSGWPLRPAIAAFAAALTFFAAMALVIGALAAMLGAEGTGALAGGGVAAWMAGFLTPGAPGGLGVREAVMVLTGGGGASPETLLVLALLFRVVTFVGDMICALIGRLAFREHGDG